MKTSHSMPYAPLDAVTNKKVTLSRPVDAKPLKSGNFGGRAFFVRKRLLIRIDRGRVTSYGHGRPQNRFHSMKYYGRQEGTAGKPAVNNQ
jgi:hypothetical protein